MLPLFGFWAQLMRKALYDLMCNQRDKIFPNRFQFVKGRPFNALPDFGRLRPRLYRRR